MAGYTRQSASSILNTLDITAAPLNAEFNAIQTSMGTGGHTHDGVAGNGPKIPLGTSVSGYLPANNGGTGGKNNITATSNPTVNDDAGDGYSVGSIWVNTTTGRTHFCVGNSTGAAVWRPNVHIQTSESSIVPDTDGGTGLGTINKRWLNLFVSGGASLGGNLTVAGTGVFTSSVSASAFNTTSDYRSKEIDGEVFDALSQIMSVRPMSGVREDEEQSRDMFIAHELQNVVPYAVEGEYDAVDDEGNAVYQTVDYSSLVPLLWAGLREATLKIEDLENRIEKACTCCKENTCTCDK